MKLNEDGKTVAFTVFHCPWERNHIPYISHTSQVHYASFGHVTYTEAIEILEKHNDEFEYKVFWGCDLQTEHERFQIQGQSLHDGQSRIYANPDKNRKEEIVEKEEQIKETEAEYEAAKQQEEEQYETMKIRIKFMYEQGDISWLSVHYSSHTPAFFPPEVLPYKPVLLPAHAVMPPA